MTLSAKQLLSRKQKACLINSASNNINDCRRCLEKYMLEVNSMTYRAITNEITYYSTFIEHEYSVLLQRSEDKLRPMILAYSIYRTKKLLAGIVGISTYIDKLHAMKIRHLNGIDSPNDHGKYWYTVTGQLPQWEIRNDRIVLFYHYGYANRMLFDDIVEYISPSIINN